MTIKGITYRAGCCLIGVAIGLAFAMCTGACTLTGPTVCTELNTDTTGFTNPNADTTAHLDCK